MIILIFVFSIQAQAKNFIPTAPLKNHYFGMRHGEAFSNVENRVCSSMKCGLSPKNGLTAKGKEQTKENIALWFKENKELVEKAIIESNFKIVTSPFSRTVETANIVRDILESNVPKKKVSILKDKKLIERFFGDLDEKNYPNEEFWKAINARDTADPTNTDSNFESVVSMESRLTQVIHELEKNKSKQPKLYFIVSHSDPLSALSNAFQQKSPQEYVQIPRFKNAEIRNLVPVK